MAEGLRILMTIISLDEFKGGLDICVSPFNFGQQFLAQIFWTLFENFQCDEI